jgi:AAA+ superfamily predicted ATPase
MVDNSNNLLDNSQNSIAFWSPVDPSHNLHIDIDPDEMQNINLLSLDGWSESRKVKIEKALADPDIISIIESVVAHVLDGSVSIPHEGEDEDEDEGEEKSLNRPDSIVRRDEAMTDTDWVHQSCSHCGGYGAMIHKSMQPIQFKCKWCNTGLSGTQQDLIQALDAGCPPLSNPFLEKRDWSQCSRQEFEQCLTRLDMINAHLNPAGLGAIVKLNHPGKGAYDYPDAETPAVPEVIDVDATISTVSDLIALTAKYPLVDNVKYNVDMKALHNIKPALIELDSMIGMHSLKSNVVDQILYFMQGFHKEGHGDFMHTVIYGPPGTGKTEVARIMGKIFKDLGVLSKGVFKKVTRSDLIAGYLGQTALKTRDVVKECLGGVMFIDEAYALGNSEKRDSFSKECIDTLCESLSDNKQDLMVIIAGYEDELRSCFFEYNQGLDSRFVWRFKTDDYGAEEMRDIFLKKVRDAGWSASISDVDVKFFEENKSTFKFFGRDIETFLAKSKVAHSRRVFSRPSSEKTRITKEDLEAGFKMFMSNEEVKRRTESQKGSWTSMYV